METSREFLYEFWDELPDLKIIILEDKKYIKNKVRSNIVQILKTGIFELVNRNKELYRRRRALNAEEIHEELDKVGIDISKTSLYFHLNKMLELGNIDVVETLREGRHNVTYYGKAAKIVLMRKRTLQDEYQELFSTYAKFLKSKNNSISLDEFRQHHKEYVKLLKSREERIAKWLGSHFDLIEEEDININNLFKIISEMESTSDDFHKFWSDFNESFSTEFLSKE